MTDENKIESKQTGPEVPPRVVSGPVIRPSILDVLGLCSPRFVADDPPPRPGRLGCCEAHEQA
jgi:hypothetical protein